MFNSAVNDVLFKIFILISLLKYIEPQQTISNFIKKDEKIKYHHYSHEEIVNSPTMIKQPYKIVRFGKKDFYLCKGNKRYSFPDRYTYGMYGITLLGFDRTTGLEVPYVSVDQLNEYKNNGKLPSEYNHKSNKELLHYANSPFIIGI
jgi:hypothetical protein